MKFGPERSFENKSTKEVEFNEAYKKALETLSIDSIGMDSFVRLYGADNVNADKDFVFKMKEKIASQTETQKEKMLATIFEAIIHEQIELSDWLGENTRTIRPTEYDDFANGIDEIVEFQEEEGKASHLALAIDVTFGSSLHEKIGRIKQEINSDKLTKIKYFKSEHMGFTGELKNVPRIIVGADAKTLNEIMDMWLAGEKKKLAMHPIQNQILQEMKMQLEAFAQYAEKNGKEKSAAVYMRTLSIIEKIISQKEGFSEPGDEDRVFSEIKHSLKNLNKT